MPSPAQIARDEVAGCDHRGHSASIVRRVAFLGLLGLLAGGCYRLPIWKGDVQVTARERASIKKCGTGELTTDGAKLVSRHPYLQATTTTSTTVAWGSLDGGGELVVREPDGGDVVATIKGTYRGEPARQAARLAKMKQPGVASQSYSR